MCSLNEGFEDTDERTMEMEAKNKSQDTSGRDDARQRPEDHAYEEALDISGHGVYNKYLLFVCFMLIIGMGVDIFGVGIIVTAAACDLNMTLQQIGILSSMPFAGIIVMSYCWGYVSDTRGRRVALLCAMCGGFLSAMLSSLSPSWQYLAALRFLSSAMSSAGESATYALLGECCSARVRARYMLLVTSALMLTPTLYYVTGYLVMKMDFSVEILGLVYRPWRLLTFLMSLPLGFSVLLLYFCSESPKFLVNAGRPDEALQALARIYRINTKSREDYPVKGIILEDMNKEIVDVFSMRSLWTQIAPLFNPPLLSRTLLLFYLTFVAYIANNSFAIILPTIFNLFFTSYSNSTSDDSFCDLFHLSTQQQDNTTIVQEAVVCEDSIMDNTVWAGCAHGLSFFILNALISRCAAHRKVLTIVIFVLSCVSALCVDNTGEPVSGLILFYIFLTTAMVFGVISSYFIDLYPTSYRGMVSCLGMMVARASAFSGTNIVGTAITHHCTATFYGAALLVFSGAVAACFLPSDSIQS